MKIHEYQAKQILAAFGVPVPKGRVAATPAEARQIAADLGVPVVIKAQIHAGGRGKGGGIKVAQNPAEAEKLAGQIIGMTLVTHQTGPEGRLVKRVLVEEALDNDRELYLGIVIDRSTYMPVVMASEAGGMDIEQVAAQTPEKILKAWVDPTAGFQAFQGRQLAYGMNMPASLVRPAGELISNLFKAFRDRDCSLAEINPLVITKDGRLLAVDAKLNFDDSALYRHKDVVELRDLDEENPFEVEASKYDVNYIKLDGNIGCMVNGAGLAMATMDIIKLVGGSPANFLDVGGSATVDRIAAAFKILLSDPNVKAVLVNIFGGILRCDILAQGIVTAVKDVQVNVPVVARMRGTNVLEGKEILAGSGLAITVANDLREAAQKAVAAVK